MTLLAIAISGAFATAMAQSTGRGPREFTLKIPTDYGSTGTSDTCNKDRYGFSKSKS